MHNAKRKSLQSLPAWLLAGIFAAAPLAQNSAFAADFQANNIKQGAAAKARQAAKKKQDKFSTEAVSALKSVREAIGLLKNGKKDTAVKKLEAASGQLDIAMAANPSLKLIPVETGVNTYDLITTPTQVKDDLKAVDELLESGDVQGARVLLGQLRSEIVTETLYMPLETYPDAIKRATREITAGQSRKARETLIVAMDTLVEETGVLPLPVVLAQGAIEDARKVRTADKDEALRDLDYARTQLETAKLLGYFYGAMDDYKAIKTNIEDIEHALKGKSKTEQLFDDVKSAFDNLIGRFSGPKKK